MKLSRHQFWVFLQVCVVVITLFYQAMWLFAQPTEGTVVYIDRGTRSSPAKYAQIGPMATPTGTNNMKQ